MQLLTFVSRLHIPTIIHTEHINVLLNIIVSDVTNLGTETKLKCITRYKSFKGRKPETINIYLKLCGNFS